MKTACICLLASAFCFLLDKIYALFAHGITSPHMTLMFLFPLAGGALVYGLLALAAPGLAQRRGWRAACNLYNAGLAALTAGSLLNGIFEIAGTASAHTRWFYLAGVGLCLAGVSCLAPRRRTPAPAREKPEANGPGRR